MTTGMSADYITKIRHVAMVRTSVRATALPGQYCAG